LWWPTWARGFARFESVVGRACDVDVDCCKAVWFVYVLQVFLLLRNNGSNSGAPAQDHDTDGVQSSPDWSPAGYAEELARPPLLRRLYCQPAAAERRTVMKSMAVSVDYFEVGRLL